LTASGPSRPQGVDFGACFQGREWPRRGNTIALRVVDADTAQLPEDFLALDCLRDGCLAHGVTHVVDRLDQRAAHGIVADVLDEEPVDLDGVDGQILQVGEG